MNNDGADGEGEYINSLAFTAIGTIWHCKAKRPLGGDALGIVKMVLIDSEIFNVIFLFRLKQKFFCFLIRSF